MATSLNEQRLLDAIAASAAALAGQAAAAGLDAAVPTCPAWDVRALLAHQTMVHRWSAGNLLGEPFTPTQTELRERPDLPAYFDAGVDHLLTTLQTVADDVDAMVFLKDPPPTVRHFWARRQAHETTIHAVDALGAALGRVPTAAEAAETIGIDAPLAVDGVDELLTGFFTRGRSKLAGDEPFTLDIVAADADAGWAVTVADGRLTTMPGSAGAPTTLSGTAVQLYLGLWNRGDEIDERGTADVLARWHAAQRVSWS